MKAFSLGWSAAVLTVLFGVQRDILAASPAPGLERFYIGTYSGAIYQSSLNLGTGSFGTLTRSATSGDPSFLALTPDRRFLYAVNEGGGAVVAFSVSATNGNLTLLNQMPSNGAAPAYVAVDRTGKNVIVANYTGGSVTVFPIGTDGKLGAATSHIQHPGTSPHPHCVTIDQSNHFALVCDAGLDQIRCYVLDAAAGTLTTNTALITSVAAKSGPRHMAFEPQYKRAYVICETASTVIAFNYDATNGTLSSFQTISTLPPGGFSGNTGAEIAVHPSGKFIYGSNRGYNSIVVYAVNADDGTLNQVQQQTTASTPRNFAIDPTGAFCIVAGQTQTSNEIPLYSINPQDGQLHDTGKRLSVTAPVCILPFILQPPQPVLALTLDPNNGLQLNIGNALSLLSYQVFQTPALAGDSAWNLVVTGAPGQTNFTLTNGLAQQFFQVGVFTNY
jgi:6-phosphogluconolactonase